MTCNACSEIGRCVLRRRAASARLHSGSDPPTASLGTPVHWVLPCCWKVKTLFVFSCDLPTQKSAGTIYLMTQKKLLPEKPCSTFLADSASSSPSEQLLQPSAHTDYPGAAIFPGQWQSSRGSHLPHLRKAAPGPEAWLFSAVLGNVTAVTLAQSLFFLKKKIHKPEVNSNRWSLQSTSQHFRIS